MIITASGEPFWPDGSYGTDPKTGDSLPWNQTYSDNPWDYVVFNGIDSDFPSVVSPGVCEVHAEPHYKHDKKKPNGNHGASLTTTGREPSDVRMRFYIWTRDQWTAMQYIIKRIWPAPKTIPDGVKGNAAAALAKNLNPLVSVGHPALSVVGVEKIVIVAVSAPQPGRTHGEMVIEMKAIELLPIMPGSGKKNASGDVAVFPNHRVEELISQGYTREEANAELAKENAFYGANAQPMTEEENASIGANVAILDSRSPQVTDTAPNSYIYNRGNQ